MFRVCSFIYENTYSKFGILNINSKSDQYPIPCVTRLYEWILKWVSIPSHIQIKWVIDKSKKEKHLIQVRNCKYIYVCDVSAVHIHILLIIFCVSSTLSMKWNISKRRNCNIYIWLIPSYVFTLDYSFFFPFQLFCWNKLWVNFITA